MNEQNYLNIREPFKNLLAQGMVLHATYKDSKGSWVYPDEVIKQDGKLIHKTSGLEVFEGKVEKMSKSKKNVVDLESILKNYSADAVRLAVLSDSPPEKDLEWTASGIEGSAKFITRLQNMLNALMPFYEKESLIAGPSVDKELVGKETAQRPENVNNQDERKNSSLRSLVHHTIKFVTEDIESFRLNKAIARIRELFNALSLELTNSMPDIKAVQEGFIIIIKLLNPFIPHITEEIWEELGSTTRLYQSSWPNYIESLLEKETYTLAIQVNGRLRGTADFATNASDEEIKNTVLQMTSLQKYIEGKDIKKIVIVPKKIVSIVV